MRNESDIMINKTLAKNVLSMGLSTGGDFAEIFIENKICNSITMVNGVVEKAISGIDYGLGLRIFNGFSSIYVYTNDLSQNNLLKIAKEASSAINVGKPVNLALDFTNRHINNIHPIKIMPETVNKRDITSLLGEASKASFSYSPRISQTGGGYLDETQEVAIINSEGLWIEDKRVRTRVMVSSVASNSNEKQTGSFGPGAHSGLELLNTINIKQLGKDSAKIAVKMLDAEFCPKGKMPVIIDKGFGGVIFHEACGHSLEATSVAKGASEFTGKIGKIIASKKVTAIDDGTIKNAWGSQNIDDEGTKTQKNVLIENGVLKSYLVDRLNGLKMGLKSTGSSRRQSYKFAPTSRMNNTYIGAGTDKEEDIIKNTEYGIYAKTMGGGSVQPATGDFNFAVTEAYIVRNGEIQEPVRGATLIGKGSEILKNIDMVSDTVEHGQGMCGSISGSIPTNVGQPMIRISEITVGGRK